MHSFNIKFVICLIIYFTFVGHIKGNKDVTEDNDGEIGQQQLKVEVEDREEAKEPVIQQEDTMFKDIMMEFMTPDNKMATDLKLNDTKLKTELQQPQEQQQQFTELPVTPINVNYTNNNDVWFKVATILVPSLGGILLLTVVVIAIRMLRNDIDAPTKNCTSTCGACNQRKLIFDFESAYGAQRQNDDNHHHPNHHHNHHQHNHNLYGNRLNLLLHQTNDKFHCNINNYNSNCTPSDYKNETQAKKNQLQTLEYTLLPQSCNDPSMKLTNTESGSTNLYRNINLSTNNTSCKRGGGAGGGAGGGSGSGVDSYNSKIYEKEILNPIDYWIVTPSNSSNVSNNCNNNNNNVNNNNNSNINNCI